MTYPDSTYITYDYDELNRMTAVRYSSGTALAAYSFDDRSRQPVRLVLPPAIDHIGVCAVEALRIDAGVVV